MLHAKDSSGHSLSYLVNNTTETMIAPQGIVMQLEKDHHMKNDHDDEGFTNLQICIRSHHGSSKKTVSSIAIINETRRMSCIKLSFQIILMICGCMLVPLSVWFGDVSTDSILTHAFYMAWQNESLILPHLMLSNDSITAIQFFFQPKQNFTTH